MRYAVMTREQIGRTLILVAAFTFSWLVFLVVGYQVINGSGSYWWAVLALPLILGAYVLVSPTLHKAKREELLLALLIQWLIISTTHRLL